MSITTEARSYADLAVTQGKTVLAQATSALNQAGSALSNANRRLRTDAPKPAYAALGAADLLAATVTKRLEDLPVDAAQGVTKAQQTGQTLLTRAQAEANARLTELRERLESSRETAAALPGTAKSAGEGYLTVAKSVGETYLVAAKDVYGSLTERGAARAAELKDDPRVVKLRQDPRLSRLLNQLGAVAEDIEGVPAATKSAFDAVAEAAEADGKPAARKAPARKAAAKKAPATPRKSSKA